MDRETLPVKIDHGKVSEFCKRNHIRKLAFFGSIIHGNFGPESDVDLLIEFAPEHNPGYFGLVRLEDQLSVFFDKRKVDLRTPNELSRYFRTDVLKESVIEYAEN